MWQDAIVYAQEGAEGAASGKPGGLGGNMFFFMAMIFGVMYFLMIRPQQKRDRKRREMLAALSKGDQVITNGGIYGSILAMNEKTVVLKVSDDPVLKMEFARSAVSQVAKEDENNEK